MSGQNFNNWNIFFLRAFCSQRTHWNQNNSTNLFLLVPVRLLYVATNGKPIHWNLQLRLSFESFEESQFKIFRLSGYCWPSAVGVKLNYF